MIERSLGHFDLDPKRLIGDTAYDSAEMLNWLVHDRGIEPHIPVALLRASAVCRRGPGQHRPRAHLHFSPVRRPGRPPWSRNGLILVKLSCPGLTWASMDCRVQARQ